MIFAIALQLPNRQGATFDIDSSAEYAKRACYSVTKKLSSGGIGLSTIQTMCLLSFWEFTGK